VEISFCITPVRSSFSVSRITFNSSGKCKKKEWKCYIRCVGHKGKWEPKGLNVWPPTTS